MAVVFIPTLLQSLTGGNACVPAQGSTVAQVIENLEKEWPGIAERLVEGTRLRPNLSVAVDGEITPLGLLEPVTLHSEVHFVAAIKGGSAKGAVRTPYGTETRWLPVRTAAPFCAC